MRRCRRITTRRAATVASRWGVVTLEALAALAVMVVLLVFVGQWTSTLMQHRRSIERRRVARQATDNVVALAMASDYGNLTDERLLSLANAYTPQRAVWDIRVDVLPPETTVQGAPVKRITVGLSFENRSQDDTRPFVVFKYPGPGESPHE